MGETAPRAETTNPTCQGRSLSADGPVDPAEIRYRPGVRREGAFTVQYVTIHGYRRAYVKAGSGPALLLIHGIGDSSDTWRPVVEQLAEHYTVIAPDLLGHGRSEKPRADYSVAGFANGMRDLLSVLEVDRATVVGHSLGGGVAAQFAYQFPDRCERLVLVGSGGVGRTVSPLLRVAAVPGIEVLMPFLGLASDPVRQPPGRRAVAHVRHCPRPRRRGDPGRPRRAAQHGGPHGHSAHAPFQRRLERPGHHHGGPGLPGRGHPDAGRVGTARRHHPVGPRPLDPHGDAGQRVRDLRRRRPLPAPHRPGALRARAARVHRALAACTL